MNKKYLIIATLIVGTASSLLADTSYAFLYGQPGNQNFYDNEAISPYSGATGPSLNSGLDTQVQLFCDDFIDNSNWASSWQVDLTAVNAAGPNALANTRFGNANANSTYPSGTALYEQLAWLYTQELNPGQTTANDDAIQEAAWTMTASAGQDTATSAPGLTGWITAAQTYYLSTAAETPTAYEGSVDYSRWTIVTDTNTIGKTSGRIDPGGTGNQEFLAYTPAGGIPATSGLNPAPEPASFLLFGGGLLAVGLMGRRKISQR
jgi:hypothetical protein